MDFKTEIDKANEYLSESLSAVRFLSWDPADYQARFEVFHSESDQTFGELLFHDVSYLQIPAVTQIAYRLRIVKEALLPSRGDIDSMEHIFEFFAVDGAVPSAFVVATILECPPKIHKRKSINIELSK